MKLDYKYTLESEIDRVIFTLKEQDFLTKNNYFAILPKGIDGKKLNNLPVLESAVRNELDTAETNRWIAKLENFWNQNDKVLKLFFDRLAYPKPDKITIFMTRYGAGGAYNINPPSIIINYRIKMDICENLIHEIIHIILEEPVIERFRLTHWEKESIVQYLLISKLSDLFPEAKYIKKPPTKKLLDRIDWI